MAATEIDEGRGEPPLRRFWAWEDSKEDVEIHEGGDKERRDRDAEKTEAKRRRERERERERAAGRRMGGNRARQRRETDQYWEGER